MILGLTGAIGCGKSTACSYFFQKGWRLFDADKSCHELYNDINAPLGRAIKECWGSGCFKPDGSLDRQVMAAKVFTSDRELEKLTALIYPALFGIMEEEISAAGKDGVNMLCEVPLLFECGTEKYFDMTCTVWSSRRLRHERLQKFRNFSPEDIARRECRQWSAEKKLEAADVAFINNGGPEFLYRQIDDFIKEYA